MNKPDSFELKFVPDDLYILLSSLKPYEPIDRSDTHYLNQSHAPIDTIIHSTTHHPNSSPNFAITHLHVCVYIYIYITFPISYTINDIKCYYHIPLKKYVLRNMKGLPKEYTKQ